MKIFTKTLSGVIAGAWLCAPAMAEIQTISFDGFMPGLALGAFYDVDSAGVFDADQVPIEGLPQFDASLGTLVDVQISFDVQYTVDAFLNGNGIVDDGLPHQIDVFLSQLVVGVTYEREDGGISGLIDVLEGFNVNCFGDAFSGDGCQGDVSLFQGFAVNGVSLLDDIGTSAVTGDDDVEIFFVEINFIDPFFDLFNIVNFEFDLFVEVFEDTAPFTITYIYDDGVSAPDEDGDGVPDDMDSCTSAANPDQIDSDGDGYGDACDIDINNDCVTNAQDLGLLRLGFFGSDPALDFNNDGAVNAVDLGIMRLNFFSVPGPSGLTDACGT